MATIRLVPSTYYLSSSYLSVSNASNMYNNTDNTTYATVTNSRSSTTSYYIYVRGFNFDDVPSNATINSFTILVKGYESGLSTSTSYAPRLYNGTGTITGASAASQTFSTSTRTITVPYTGDWDELKSFGSNLGIRCTVRRASSGTTGYLYLQGAEIEVNYTLPVAATVTSSLTGSGTISPSGAYSCYEGDEYTLTITPTDKTASVTATKDGSDITSQLVSHYAGGTLSTVLGTYSLISGSFNSGESWFEGIVGQGHDTTNTTTSNYYSGSSSTQAVFQYQTPITVPSGATITRAYIMANGHCESTTQSSEYMCVQLKSGSTDLTPQYNFKDHGTSNGTVTVEATTLPTVAQCASMVVECTLGYYGGAINGVTVFVEYEVPSTNPEYYTYTYTVDGNATIAVTIGGTVETAKLYKKINGAWVEIAAAYRKVNGSWVEVSDVTTVFSSGTNYKEG